MQHRVGRSTSRGYCCNPILKCGAGKNISRPNFPLQQVQHDLAAIERNLILLRVHGRHTIESHRRQAEHLHHGRHRVRRILSAARTCSRTCHVLQLVQFLVCDLARRVRSHGFKNILDGHILPAITSGRDRSSIKHEPGKIQPCQRHGRRRNRLVAADHAHHGVKQLSATDQFN